MAHFRLLLARRDYKKCLFSGGKQYRKMKQIRSYKHVIFTEERNKVALSGDDDKREILPDKIHTLAYGHYETRSCETITIYPCETITILPRV